MAIAEGRRLGGFLCPYAERTYGALRLPEITLSGFSRSVFRLFTLCFQDFFGCRKFRFYLIPSRQSARRMKRLTAAGSVSQQRDCRRQRRDAVRTIRPDGRMTLVMTAAMSVAVQCSIIR